MIIEELNQKIEASDVLIDTLCAENLMRVGGDVVGGGWRASVIPVIRYVTQAEEEVVTRWVNAHPTLEHMCNYLSECRRRRKESNIINLK